MEFNSLSELKKAHKLKKRKLEGNGDMRDHKPHEGQSKGKKQKPTKSSDHQPGEPGHGSSAPVKQRAKNTPSKDRISAATALHSKEGESNGVHTAGADSGVRHQGKTHVKKKKAGAAAISTAVDAAQAFSTVDRRPVHLEGGGKGLLKQPEEGNGEPSGAQVHATLAGKPRLYTISIAVPGSVVDNAQSKELKTVLVGQIARAAAVFQVDEIVVYDDGMGSARAKESGWNPNDFMARLLQYVETPQYLRRQLIPMHPDLKFAGLLAPLDAPHHVRAGEWSAYREGVVVERPASAPSRAGDSGSFVYIGTKREARIDRKLAAGMRVTVALHPEDVDPTKRSHRGTAVAASRPREERGLYWGYSTRLAATLGDVIAGGPYAGGYDLTLGTSERGHATLDDEGFGVRPFKHALIVFGGVQGIEASIDNDESLEMPGADAHTLFDMWVNIAPRQGSRTIRTEEAVLITLARLQGPILRAVGDA